MLQNWQARCEVGHFNRAFKASFHETLTSHIMRQRVSLAQEKMLTTDRALSRIALECVCATKHISAVCSETRQGGCHE
jgi:transcriptional regulator GlxA family with amidase domain